MKRLAIISTHPIQYYAPIFKLLAQHQQLEIKVFYTLGNIDSTQFDPGFGRNISWDVPLLEGYNFQFENNTAKKPGSDAFWGIRNPDLIKNIKHWKADALLVFGWAYQSHLQVLIYFKNRIPIFFRGDSTLLDKKNGVKNSIKKKLLKLIYSRIDHAFYVGTNNKAYFKYCGLKKNQIIFAHHATDNERFSIKKIKESIELREKFGVSPNEILILFAGKLQPKKNPELLMQAFNTLNQQNTHLLFVGNGMLEKELKNKKKILETASRIHFLDFQNQLQMPAVYQSCDLFCLPSSGPGETWGLSVNETMACGKAILVSNKVGCAVDLVFEGKNGAIFKSGNETDLVEKLLLLCRQKFVLEKYGLASAEIIKDWNFENTAKTIENEILKHV